MAAPKEIVALVERFERNLPEYQSNTYKEAQTRQEFINPFFKALGWDMDNEQGFSETYKEVLHESSLKVGSTTKAPDYAFKIGENIKFLVEAKKPYVNLEESADPAYQLRSYAWNAKLPISILTDFEEFAIYDCRYPPKKADRANTALIRYLKYTDYIRCWDWIAKNFSKKAIQQGYLDKLLLESKGKKGTKEVDAVFLEEITSWREDLAHNIALRNSDLKVEELNASVQATIDRIVFLRICEDRGIEKYGQIQGIASGENIYAGLCDLFKHADDRYNSGLFHFKKEPGREYPDLLALDLKIDDKVLKDITSSLYPPSPYNFAIISPEILGQVYEQFLGKIIRLTDGHRAKVDDKPEVKKAGGVKYTPAYIVQNIVRKTLGPLIKGKTPLEVALIRVLDPACGSGSFLLVAYKYLLDWHLDWYIKNLAPVLGKGYSITSVTVRQMLPYSTEDEDNDKSQKIKTGIKAKRIKAKAEARASAASIPIYKTNDGEWHLTITERKRILLNNIYGVDIDRQAVEVTKLSLLLKVLEGENQQTVANLLKYSRERALPDLDGNIKCGNSLVGVDFYEEHPGITGNELARINPFDWYGEFPEVMQNGGFHAIVGNPPYIRIQTMTEWVPLEVEYYKQKYASAGKGNYDIYVIFLEKGLSLLNELGMLGFILPHKFFNAKYGLPLRTIISQGKHLSEIVHFGYQQVFEGVTTYTCLLFLSKTMSDDFKFLKVDSLDEWKNAGSAKYAIIPTNRAGVDEWVFAAGREAALLDKLNEIPMKLKDVTSRIFQGIKTSADKIYIVKELERKTDLVRIYSKERNAEYWIESDLLHPLIKGGDSKAYLLSHNDLLILFPYAKQGEGQVGLIPESTLRTKYPLTWVYLLDNKEYLENRENGKMQGPKWYGYIYPKALDVMSLPKIFTPDIATVASFSLDDDGDIFFTGGVAGGYGILAQPNFSMKFIMALLNSKLLDWLVHQSSTQMNGGYYSYESRFISSLPICTLDLMLSKDNARHDRLIALTNDMLSLKKQLSEARTGHEQTLLQRQIEATDNQIDTLVYELYGLTEEEIRIVEGA